MGLFKPKWKTDNMKKKDRAIAEIKGINDEETLYEISQTAPLEDVRIAAVVRIKDRDIQKRVLDNCVEQKVLCALLKEIEPPKATFVTINWEVIRSAMEKISDQKMLAELAQKGHVWSVYRLKDKEELFKIFSEILYFRKSSYLTQDEKEHIAMIASKDFTGKDEILDVAKATCYEVVASDKVEEIIKNGWMSLEEIALDKTFSTKSRVVAIQKISDPKIIEEILSLDDENMIIYSNAKNRLSQIT